MKLQEHIDKVGWTIADKFLFFLYFFVLLIQVNALKPSDYGLFELLRNLNIWMLGLSDSLVLQGLIQFGINEKQRRKVNTLSLIVYSTILLVFSFVIFLFSSPLAEIFKEPMLIDVATALPLLTALSIPRNYLIKVLFREYKLKRIFVIDLVYFAVMAGYTAYLRLSKPEFDFYDMVNILLIGTAASSFTAILLSGDKLQFGFKGSFKTSRLFFYGTPLMLQGIFHSLPKYLDVFIVQYFFSTATVGVYALTKNLYRIFDDAVSSVYGLVFPATVKQFESGDRTELNSLMTKGLSFTFVIFALLFIILEAGMAEYLIKVFLPERYYGTIGQFQVMMIAALFLPFILLTAVITASEKPQVTLLFSIIAATFSFLGYLFAGYLNNPDLIPLGIILYNFVIGILAYIYIKYKFGFPINMLFRSIKDTTDFIKGLRNNRS